MVQNYNHSNHIINMDRYYCRCITSMNLKKKGLYSRCTSRTSVKHYPTSIAYQKNDMRHYGRGSSRFSTEDRYGMVDFSWCDVNPVNILTTEYGSVLKSVKIKIGKQKYTIQAPMAVR